MQMCDPLTARQRFRLRTPTNWAIVLVVFVPLVFALQNYLPVIIADAIAIAIAFSIFFFVLHKRVIGIACPHCRQYLETNTPWICGFKQCRNEQVDDFPFIYRCQHCGAEPKAYQCHHCGELIFFTEDNQKINYAKCVNVPGESRPVSRDRHEDEITQRKKDIEISELSVKKAKIDVELKAYKETLEPSKPKTARERLRSKVGSKTELDDEVRRMKAEADEKFKDDPAERERQHRTIEDEARDLLT